MEWLACTANKGSEGATTPRSSRECCRKTWEQVEAFRCSRFHSANCSRVYGPFGADVQPRMPVTPTVANKERVHWGQICELGAFYALFSPQESLKEGLLPFYQPYQRLFTIFCWIPAGSWVTVFVIEPSLASFRLFAPQDVHISFFYMQESKATSVQLSTSSTACRSRDQ